jgi:hypothetical protein
VNATGKHQVLTGFELRTGVRFATNGGRPGFLAAQINDTTGEQLATLTYGDTATIWRITV